MIDTPGIYRMTLEEYVADPCNAPSLNAATVQILEERSPYHAFYHHPRLGGATRESAAAFDVGTAFHAMLLEGAEVFVVVDETDWKKKSAQAKRAEIRKAGQIPLLTLQRVQLGLMHKSVMRALSDYPELPVPFTKGEPERTLLWQAKNGVWCRCRPDWLTGDGRYSWDLKCTGVSAHPSEYGRMLFAHGADLQGAMVERGVTALLKVEPEHRLVVVETEPPHGVSILALDPEARERASAIVRNAIDTWGTCLKTGRWPSYTLRTATVELPPWLRAKSEVRAYYRGGAE